MMSALTIQIGGSHYKDCAIQPIEYIHANNLGFLAGCIVKRITRYDKPTGKGLQDLQKIKHEIDLLIEMMYGKQELPKPELLGDKKSSFGEPYDEMKLKFEFWFKEPTHGRDDDEYLLLTDRNQYELAHAYFNDDQSFDGFYSQSGNYRYKPEYIICWAKLPNGRA